MLVLVPAHLLEHCTAARVGLGKRGEMALEMALDLGLGFGEEAHAPTISCKPGDHAEAKRARIPERVQEARPRFELFQPCAAPREVVALLARGPLQRRPHCRVACEEGLP